jgi:hypothetical protein
MESSVKELHEALDTGYEMGVRVTQLDVLRNLED